MERQETARPTLRKRGVILWRPKEVGDGVSMVAGGVAERRRNFLGRETELERRLGGAGVAKLECGETFLVLRGG